MTGTRKRTEVRRHPRGQGEPKVDRAPGASGGGRAPVGGWCGVRERAVRPQDFRGRPPQDFCQCPSREEPTRSLSRCGVQKASVCDHKSRLRGGQKGGLGQSGGGSLPSSPTTDGVSGPGVAGLLLETAGSYSLPNPSLLLTPGCEARPSLRKPVPALLAAPVCTLCMQRHTEISVPPRQLHACKEARSRKDSVKGNVLYHDKNAQIFP